MDTLGSVNLHLEERITIILIWLRLGHDLATRTQEAWQSTYQLITAGSILSSQVGRGGIRMTSRIMHSRFLFSSQRIEVPSRTKGISRSVLSTIAHPFAIRISGRVCFII
jgi:hypothetical protein